MTNISEHHVAVSKTLPVSFLKPGKVYLVGAGPGDPDLITVKGIRCIRSAQMIVYDRLVHPAILEEAQSDAGRIFVGKEPGSHAHSQQEINQILIDHARLGKSVVRLKGGDPFVFGRGGEEALALADAGIDFEIVPGISSAIAVPAYAGIPVTHRAASSLFTIVTGHDLQIFNQDVWQHLAKLGGTLVFLMGVAKLEQITQRLLTHGIDPQTPAAAIQNGATSRQRSIYGTVSTLFTKAMQERLQNPAVIVIGEVVALHTSLAWFERHYAANAIGK